MLGLGGTWGRVWIALFWRAADQSAPRIVRALNPARPCRAAYTRSNPCLPPWALDRLRNLPTEPDSRLLSYTGHQVVF